MGRTSSDVSRRSQELVLFWTMFKAHMGAPALPSPRALFACQPLKLEKSQSLPTGFAGFVQSLPAAERRIAWRAGLADVHRARGSPASLPSSAVPPSCLRALFLVHLDIVLGAAVLLHAGADRSVL